MKVKTSVTLSQGLLRSLRKAARRHESRSETIERLVSQALAAERRRAADERDMKIINEHADELNAEALDVLKDQIDW